MKNVLITLSLVAVAFIMTACSSESYIGDEYPEEPTQSVFEDASTRSGAGAEQTTRIRVGMYEIVDGYTVEISNVRFQNIAGTHHTPEFGNNFEGAVVSHDAYAPTYDTADGSFATVEVGTKLTLVMTFDVKLIFENREAAPIIIKGVRLVITDNNLVISQDKVYDIPVVLDSSTLHLDSIDFSAEVNNWQSN